MWLHQKVYVQEKSDQECGDNVQQKYFPALEMTELLSITYKELKELNKNVFHLKMGK